MRHAERNVFIIHGYRASPERHWFPWLKQKLLADGSQVEILDMPTPQNPDYEEWLDHLDQHIGPLTGALSKNTYFVAHSLGCISLLNDLQQACPREAIGGMLLVSGFAHPLPELKLLDAFTRTRPNYEKIQRMVPKRYVVASHNDPVVPFALTKELAQKLDADFIGVDQGGHFMAQDGFTTFPLAYALVQRMMKDKACV